MTDTEPSRLEAAETAQNRANTEWFRSPLVLLAGLILLAGVLAVIVVSLSGGDEKADDADNVVATGAAADPGDEAPAISFGGPSIPEVAPVALTGEVLPKLVPDEPDTALGLRAPDAVVSSLANGASITLGPGRARVLGFFAHWCPHCRVELPEVAAWLADNQLPPNVEFVAISTGVSADADNYPPSDWFTSVGWTAPVVVDDAEGSLLSGYGFGGFPAFIAIDASGTVVGRSSGNIGIEGLEDLLAKFAS